VDSGSDAVDLLETPGPLFNSGTDLFDFFRDETDLGDFFREDTNLGDLFGFGQETSVWDLVNHGRHTDFLAAFIMLEEPLPARIVKK
jgi:hypothetical protein